MTGTGDRCLCAASRAPQRRAFTLVELVVALIIGVIVTGSTTAVIRQFSRAKARAVARQEAFARAGAAADRIAADIEQFARDGDLLFAKVVVSDGGDQQDSTDGLQLVTRSLRRVRVGVDNPEGADREVQYRVAATADSGSTALWRRTDAPADTYLDAGGIAEPVVRGVTGLSIQASDGAAWVGSWDSDRDGYPHGIRVTVTARSDDGATRGVARRVVALDRTPLPIPAAEEPASSGASAGRFDSTGITVAIGAAR